MLADGTLTAGDELCYVRRVKGELHIAHILADGRLQLADGSCHSSLSAAVSAACKGKVTEGWNTRRRAKDGRTMAELRDKHLARARSSS